jgi:signal transduction histidine kinase
VFSPEAAPEVLGTSITEPPPPRPTVRTLWLTGLAGVAVVTLFSVLAATSGRLPHPAIGVLVVSWITVPYLVSGLIAWWRRPVSRLGPLMLAAGFVTPLSLLPFADNQIWVSIGELFEVLPAAIYLHVFLAYPTGRLHARPEQLTVVSCYVATLLPTAARVMLGHDPTNIFTVTVNPVAALRVEQVQFSIICGLLLCGAVLLYVRRRALGRSKRRFAALLVDSFGLALVSLAALSVGGIWPWPGIGVVQALTSLAMGLAPVVFLVGLLDMRLARTDIGGLLVELDRDPTLDLQAPLARALHDPSLELAYWLPDQQIWTDQDGHPVPLPGPEQRRSIRLIYRNHEPIAALFFDPSLADEEELLNAVSAAAGIALENGRLKAELRAKLKELQSARVRALEAGRRERQRLERNLHDGAQQRLVGISIELGSLENRVNADPQLRQRLARTREEVSASLDQLRDIARGIYPAVLSGHGLAVALESLTAGAALPVDLRVGVTERLPEAVEVAAYYIVSEALANIGKHAHASTATVRVDRDADVLIVEVIDDGIGGASMVGGSGLRGLRDRAEVLGGQLLISTTAGGGTTIRAEIPCG